MKISPPAVRREAAADAIDPAKLPRHVAVIMDGNGRWAKSRGLPRLAGHKAGVDSVREIVREASRLGIKALTLYTFSTENWLRPKSEVDDLMGLLSLALRREIAEMGRNNVRLRLIGRWQALPPGVKKELARSVEKLKDNNGLELVLALNYGSRQEIVDAVNSLIASGAAAVSEESLNGALDTAGLPEPDLVIRTSGEMRLSNFLLWQSAYAEIYITPLCWPDFRASQLDAAIAEYQKRTRRFGGLGPEADAAA